MKRILLVLILAGSLAACKKEVAKPVPVSNFSFARSTAAEIRMGATDTAKLISTATNASSISWDFGDGNSSTEAQPIISYAKAGTYKVTLTAKASDGTIATSTKTVTVLERVLKNIVINNIYWNNTDAMYAEAGWPKTDNADIYVKIQLLAPKQFPAGSFTPDAPVVYQSPVLGNIAKVTNTPLNINVDGKIVLDRVPLLDRRYLISLVAKNSTGEYVLVNNWYSGSYQSIQQDDITKNAFQVTTGLFSNMALNFDFEQ